jgi:hypothetical protein
VGRENCVPFVSKSKKNTEGLCVCVCVCDTTSEYTKLYLFDDFVWFSQAIEGNERENAKESRTGKLVIRKVETEMRKLKSRANLIIIAVNKCK